MAYTLVVRRGHWDTARLVSRRGRSNDDSVRLVAAIIVKYGDPRALILERASLPKRCRYTFLILPPLWWLRLPFKYRDFNLGANAYPK